MCPSTGPSTRDPTLTAFRSPVRSALCVAAAAASLCLPWPGDVARAADTAEPERVELPFVTNRVLEDNAGDEVKFTTEAGETTGGRCLLSVYELPDAEVVVETLETRPVDATLDALTPGATGHVTLYVHG